jgi:adenine-specific DNA-methyltransferase
MAVGTIDKGAVGTIDKGAVGTIDKGGGLFDEMAVGTIDTMAVGTTAATDIGFKVFKLDSSNLKIWDGTPLNTVEGKMYFDRLNGMIDIIQDGRSHLDVVYECMLRLGITLTCQVTECKINEKKVFSVAEEDDETAKYLFCLEHDVKIDFVETLAELHPLVIVLAEHSFVDDKALANTQYLLKNREIALKLV